MSSKRQKTRGFGESSELDTAVFQTNEPSSRILPLTDVPSLVTLCDRRFASCFKSLRHSRLWDSTISRQLLVLPDYMIPKLFSLLRNAHPGFLPHEIIVTYFLRGPSISISTRSGSLPGANQNTVMAIPRVNPQVRDLDLSGFDKLSDDIFAKVISQLPALRSLVLRKCSKVSSKTITAIVHSCPDIRAINLNDTSVTPGAIAELLIAHGKQLEVLKFADLQRWTDATFMTQLHPRVRDAEVNMPKLQTLKLRGLQLSDPCIGFLVSLCPNIKRLDVSFTLIKHPATFSSRQDLYSKCATFEPPLLEKLSLTSTPVAEPDLLSAMEFCSKLQTLSLGALGIRGSLGASSAVTLNDSALRKLLLTLQSIPSLQHVSLVSNTRLGATSQGALHDFLQQVGRKCLYLNLSGISSLRSNAMAGLLPMDEQTDPPKLETLVLNNTGLDDDSKDYIACCTNLTKLELEGTKFTNEGLFTIIDACPKLQVLNLTSCRGVRIADRRRFFEVWKSHQVGQEL